MSYRRYNNTGRYSGYNTPGTFVPSAGYVSGTQNNDTNMRSAPLFSSPQQYSTMNKPIPQDQSYNMNQDNEESEQAQPPSNYVMETNGSEAASDGNETFVRPHWMKPKLQGLKKVPNKERRRRQNENLRRLLTPKNALMVLNEIMPGEQVANQFKVEARAPPNAQFYKPNAQSFCAELTVRGVTYKGFGETKMAARNQAAEQAIRDLMLQRMTRFLQQQDSQEQPKQEDGQEDVAMTDGGEEVENAMPMIQLCSYALHKLFAEWEFEGHKVPTLRPNISASSAASEAGSEPDSVTQGKATKAPKVKEVPPHAASMHPGMLLSYMRTGFEYREVAVGTNNCQFGTRFTMAVDTDGQTFTATATSKKEARRLAAKAACEQLFNVKFEI